MQNNPQAFPEHGWAIVGVHGVYYGFSDTRSRAIQKHTQALGSSWAYCRKKGDRAVKVTMIARNREGK